MNATRLWIKRTVAAILYYSGALRLYAHVALRGKAVVLTYHRVLPSANQRQSFSSPAIIVTPETFERHLSCIRKWLRPLSLASFAAHVENRQLPSRACLVTFDDGWYDNLDHALPVLIRQRIPIVLFAATGFIGSADCFWQEKLARLLFASRQHQERARPLLAEFGAAHLLALTDDDARTAIFNYVAQMKAERQNVQTLIERLQSLLGAPNTASHDDRFLDVDQLQRLAASGLVEVASHGVSHGRLPFVDDEQLTAELANSRQALASWLRQPPSTLAYPNGDYDERVMAAAERAGYSIAFTTERGWVTSASRRLALKRINMHEAAAPTKAMFMCRVLGLM